MKTEKHEGGRASALDLPPAELEELARTFSRMALDYLARPSALPVFPETSAEKLKGLFRGPLPEEGAGLNSNVTSWRSAPAPTEVERTVVGWLAEMIGYRAEGTNESCGGLLTSGG